MWYNWRAPSYNIQIFEPRLVRNRYVQLKERQLWAIAVETVRVFPTIGKTKKAFVIIPYTLFFFNKFRLLCRGRVSNTQRSAYSPSGWKVLLSSSSFTLFYFEMSWLHGFKSFSRAILHTKNNLRPRSVLRPKFFITFHHDC